MTIVHNPLIFQLLNLKSAKKTEFLSMEAYLQNNGTHIIFVTIMQGLCKNRYLGSSCVTGIIIAKPGLRPGFHIS